MLPRSFPHTIAEVKIMKSVWQEEPLPRFPTLRGDIKTDVLIIGGGIAGLLTAYYLQKNGVDYVLVEKGRICGGNTQYTTAKITAQHGLIYHKLMKNGGTDAARQYLRANLTALDEYAKLAADIDCDFSRKDNYIYSCDAKLLDREAEALTKLDCGAELVRELPLPLETAGAVKLPRQAQFSPLKLLGVLAKELRIYEHSFVREMIGNIAVTDGGRIKADAVVAATHFPFINKHGGYFLKLYQDRSYVIALANAPDVGGMYADEKKDGFSFRNAGELLLLGGGGNRPGKKNGGWEALREFAKEQYPDAEERYYWAAQDCMTLDSVPYIGQYGRRTPQFYVETGFNKWGMTGAMVAALLISDKICGRENEFAELFNPSRGILKPQLLLNGAEALAGLCRPSKKTCPHMGCALRWNAAEQSWDCPCHGSRFAADGTVLDNPASGDLPE